MLEAISASLIAAAIAKGSSLGIGKLREKLMQSDPLETSAEKFEEVLRKELFEFAKRHDSIEADTLDNQWHKLADELDETELILETEEEVTKRIAEKLIDVFSWELAEEEKEELQLAVTRGYSAGISEFKEAVRGTPFADDLQLDTEIFLVEKLSTIEHRLHSLDARLQSQRYYKIFQTDELGMDAAIELIYQQGGIETSLPFIQREELNDIPPSQNYLLIGRKGSGKTRSVINLLKHKQINNNIDEIIVPTSALTRTEDLAPLLKESFQGNVALVWDDIHGINTVDDNQVFREAVLKLEEKLEVLGHELFVIAAARSESIEQLPHYSHPDNTIWTKFHEIRLKPLNPDVAEELIDISLNHLGVSITTSVVNVGR